jgi:hypothetical protein
MSWVREPVTKKAFAAISKYAIIKAGDFPVHHLMVKYVLEAEKMKRADLYGWMERKGYRWQAGYWVQKDGKPTAYQQKPAPEWVEPEKGAGYEAN